MGETFKVAEEITRFKVGDTIKWGSQAAGVEKVKKGVIIAVLRANQDLLSAIVDRERRKPKESAVKAQSYSCFARYVIRVQPPAQKRAGAKRGYTDPAPVYYAPLVRVIDGKSRSAGKSAGSSTR